jgi:hypothetical protein
MLMRRWPWGVGRERRGEESIVVEGRDESAPYEL